MPTQIYRITHYKNLDFILKHGLHCCNAKIHDPDFVGIGNQSVMSKRSKKEVVKPPGGVLDDYVPFYFGIHSVMLLNIHTDRVPGVSCSQSKIIYIVSSVEQVIQNGGQYVFTDGHALDILSNQYNDLKDLKKLDLPLIKAKYWPNTQEDNDRQRRKQAEFLVFQKVQVSCILGIGVYNDKMKNKIDIVLHDNDCGNIPCLVKRNWYYD